MVRQLKASTYTGAPKRLNLTTCSSFASPVSPSSFTASNRSGYVLRCTQKNSTLRAIFRLTAVIIGNFGDGSSAFLSPYRKSRKKVAAALEEALARATEAKR
jgi:hypothetical protein